MRIWSKVYFKVIDPKRALARAAFHVLGASRKTQMYCAVTTTMFPEIITMRFAALFFSCLLFVSSTMKAQTPTTSSTTAPQGAPTVAEAQEFIKNAEAKLD